MENLGRRQRKKLETAAAIEWAALYLAVTDGLGAMTVESISERADVTSRTFSNYFASKENAVLGITKAAASLFEPFDEVDPDPGASVFDQARMRIRSLLTEPGQGDVQRTRLRREVVKRHPELIAHEYRHLLSAGHDLSVWIDALLRAEDDSSTDVERMARTTTIVHTIGAAYQIGASAWSSDSAGDRSLAEHYDEAFSRMSALLRQVDAS